MTARHRVSKHAAAPWPGLSGSVDVDGRAPPWLSRQQFDEPASELAFADAIAAVDGLTARKSAMAERLSRLATDEQWWPTVARLRCFRGIDTLTALALHLELGGDWQRFKRAPALGVVAGADAVAVTSPASLARSGSITKTGSTLARRLLVESAWHYSRQPRIGATLRNRQAGPARPHPADLKPRPAAPAPRPPPDARPRQAAQRHRRRVRPRARLLPLGRRHRRLTPPTTPHRSVRPGRRAIERPARAIRSMSSTPTRGATLVPRQRTPAARNRALGYPTPASSDWQRRHRARRPALPTPPHRRPPSRRDHTRRLDVMKGPAVVVRVVTRSRWSARRPERRVLRPRG